MEQDARFPDVNFVGSCSPAGLDQGRQANARVTSFASPCLSLNPRPRFVVVASVPPIFVGHPRGGAPPLESSRLHPRSSPLVRCIAVQVEAATSYSRGPLAQGLGDRVKAGSRNCGAETDLEQCSLSSVPFVSSASHLTSVPALEQLQQLPSVVDALRTALYLILGRAGDWVAGSFHFSG